jgi:hypothetical protein
VGVVEHAVDPLIIEARQEAQRQAARAPMMPRGPVGPTSVPPQSGKPIWRVPHSR